MEKFELYNSVVVDWRNIVVHNLVQNVDNIMDMEYTIPKGV